MNLFGFRERDIEFRDKVLLRDDPKFAGNKILIFQIATIAVFLFLIAGFWRLQVLEVATYREAADKNIIKSIPIHAPRGKILDRDGRVIVDSHTSFSAILSRSAYNEAHLPVPLSSGLCL